MIFYETQLKARSYECDLYGHVNNSVYLNYMEAARVEFLSKMGLTLEALKEAGFLLPIIKIEIEYKKPLYAEDEISVTVNWLLRGKSSSVFEQQVIHRKSGQLAAKARITWATINLQGKPIPIPDEMLQRVQDIFHELPPVKA